MARRELVDGFVSGRIGEKEFVSRLIATGMTIATAVAFALSLAGGAQASTQAQARQAASFVCDRAGDFYGYRLEMVRCPDYFSAIGAPAVFEHFAIVIGPVTWNLDYAMVGGVPDARLAPPLLTLNGLAPGLHHIEYTALGFFGPMTARWDWITPGAAAENIVVSNFGPGNSRAQISWTSQIPAWRTYCSVNGSVERICRQPAGLALSGLPVGPNLITIRATNGPLDPGRLATITFDRASPGATLSINADTPWGPMLAG